MMQSENRLFDDLSKFLNGAAGTLAGMGREAETMARSRAKEWLGGLDLVGRDEFEAVKAMAAAARDEADALRARLDALEGRTATGGSPVATAAGTAATSSAHGPSDAASTASAPAATPPLSGGNS